MIQSQIKNWIALYTRPRWEKAVASQLYSLGMESYVPIKREVRKWSDRKKKVEIPLLPSYVLVRIESQNYRQVYQTDGIVRIVTFCGRVAVVRQKEVDLLRAIEGRSEPIEVVSNTFCANEDVEIISGPFAGYTGKIVRGDDACRVAIVIEELGHVVLLHVPRSYLKRIERVRIV